METMEETVTAISQQQIRRHSNGSIDTEYYLARGRAERGYEVRRTARAAAGMLRRLVRRVFSHAAHDALFAQPSGDSVSRPA